jgi:hypothetical protein
MCEKYTASSMPHSAFSAHFLEDRLRQFLSSTGGKASPHPVSSAEEVDCSLLAPEYLWYHLSDNRSRIFLNISM